MGSCRGWPAPLGTCKGAPGHCVCICALAKSVSAQKTHGCVLDSPMNAASQSLNQPIPVVRHNQVFSSLTHLFSQVEVCDVPHRLERRGHLRARGQQPAEDLIRLCFGGCLLNSASGFEVNGFRSIPQPFHPLTHTCMYIFTWSSGKSS